MFVGKTNSEVWDNYVVAMKSNTKINPGDEWGNKDHWEILMNEIQSVVSISENRVFLEIGQGSGKYTKMILDRYPNSKVHCFDISSKYLDVARDVLKNYEGRVTYNQLGNDVNEIIDRMKDQRVDCFFSMDAMVHVDLQILISYMISARVVLKSEGKLIMTLADCLNTEGFRKLLQDAPAYYKLSGSPSTQFRWLSRDLVTGILNKVGFNSVNIDVTPDQRDMLVIASR